MKRGERSIGALLMAVVALGLLGLAYTGVWFEYDHSTGRQTAPDGPYDEDGVEREHLEYHATGWQGDVDPSDPALAQDAVDLMTSGIFVAAILLGIVVLGEIPWIARIIRRPFSLVLILAAFATIIAVTALAWTWLPESMAGHGVDSQYTARLDEPEGYTHSTMGQGWYAVAVSLAAIFGTGLFKFQAGRVDIEDLKAADKRAADAS